MLGLEAAPAFAQEPVTLPSVPPSAPAPGATSAALPPPQAEQQGPAIPQTPQVLQPDGQSGQWVATENGWIWVPAGATTYGVEGVPYAYLYTPAYGWTWYASPWGWGPYSYGAWATHPWPFGFRAWGYGPQGWGWRGGPGVGGHFYGGGHFGGGHFGGGHFGGGGGHGGGGHGGHR
jgi:hypothetical protein